MDFSSCGLIGIFTVSAGKSPGRNASLTVTTSPDGIKADAKAAFHDEKVPANPPIDGGQLQVGAATASYQLGRKDLGASANASVVVVGTSATTSGGPTNGTFNISAGNANANAGVGKHGVSAGAEASVVTFGSSLSAKIGKATITVSSQVNVLGAGAKFNANLSKGSASAGIGASFGLGANFKVDVKW